MNNGSWKAPFLFIWRIISYIPIKLGNSIIDPTERGKVYWYLFGILVLIFLGVRLVFPTQYNQAVVLANSWLSPIGYRIDLVDEADFNLGLDLQGGAHLVYQANLADVEQSEQAEAVARLRDRIERRVNALGVSEPLVQNAGDDRLVVELAGVDVSEAISRIGATPLLEFREPSDGEPQRELTEEERTELEEFNEAQYVKAEEAFNRAISGTESFEDLAVELSEAEGAASNRGDLGTVTKTSHPTLIEEIQNTRIGRIHRPIIDAEDGYYIIRVDDRRETGEEMQLSHILFCYDGATGCERSTSRDEALAEAQTVLADISASNFAEKATEFSTDPSVSQNQGDLGWVAPGDLVEDFEKAAAEMSIGDISGPIETEFGYHIIYKQNARPLEETDIHGIFFTKKVEADYLPEQDEWKNTGLSGSNVVDAQLVFAPQTNAPQVSIQFDEEGTKMFADLTRKYLGQQIAIYLDGRAISIPNVQQPITDGQAVISGGFTIEQARELARSLKDGALPVTIELIQQQQVGATLGADSLDKSLRAGVIGLLLVAIFMLVYYRLLGFVAVIALGIYGLLTLALFKFAGVTLTLSGIAGFVLSIGMAVDANVLIFERFREERAENKDLEESIRMAFQRAKPSIIDGNVSTLITCFILGSFGTSLVQGFAVTLALGIIISMFSALFITQTILKIIAGWSFIRKLTPLFGSGWRLKG